MTTNRVQVPLQLWYRFRPHRFSVKPELMGKSHEFEFNGKRVTITLPTVSEDPEEHDAKNDNAKAICQSWFLIEENRVPACYVIREIDIRVRLSEKPDLHPDMLSLSINQYNLIEQGEQTALNTLCNTYFDLAATAFEYWLAILRWKTGNYVIGRHITVGNASGWTPRLVTVESDKPVWAAPFVLKVEKEHETSEAEWNEVGESLKNFEEVPAHIVLLQDSQEYLNQHDYRRSLIDIAISCEVYLRFKVLNSLRQNLSPLVLMAVESMNISQYVTKFFSELLTEEGRALYQPLNKHLTSLFDARNKIMHMNNHERANSEQCIRFIELAKKLFDLDKFI